MGFLLFCLIPALAFGLPLVVLTDRISERAESRGCRPALYLWVAVIGSFAGWIAASASVVALMNARVRYPLNDCALYMLFVVFGAGGATVVPLLSYTRLCMRTVRNPDYEEVRAARPSQVADVRQPRDRDDLLAE